MLSEANYNKDSPTIDESGIGDMDFVGQWVAVFFVHVDLTQILREHLELYCRFPKSILHESCHTK